MPGMRRGSRASVAMLIALVGLLLSVSTAAALSTYANPPSGTPGTQVLVSGAAWPAGLDLRVMWDDGTTVLGNTKVDGGGNFALPVTIPASATAGLHNLRVSAWLGQYVPACIAVTVDVAVDVTVAGAPTATVGTTTATATPPTVATVTDPTCVAPTATGSVTTTATASTTTTSTSTSTSTATVSVTPTPTGTRATNTPTRTPTRTKLPATGSAGLLDDVDGDGGNGASTYVALVLLGAGVALAGSYVLRQRRDAT